MCMKNYFSILFIGLINKELKFDINSIYDALLPTQEG